MTTKNHRISKIKQLSPLRYPGGKALLAPYISGVLEENYLAGCTFYEPYAGGSSVSLYLLKMGFIDKAVLIERDPLVFSFWKSVLEYPNELIDLVKKCPITLDNWTRLQPLREVEHPTKGHDYSLTELGLAGLFFNRTNFSGIMGAGPIGGMSQSSNYKIDCRFNKETVCQLISEISRYKKRIDVRFDDALKFLKRNAAKLSTEFAFVYIDPPYYAQGKKLYRHFYEDSDHQALAEYITSQGYPWVVSYDDHPRIRELYAKKRMQPIYLDYKVKSNRTAQELVISNLVIPPPVYEGSVIEESGHATHKSASETN